MSALSINEDKRSADAVVILLPALGVGRPQEC